MNTLERMVGSGALLGVLGQSVHAFGSLPADVRSAIWGAVGASLAYAVGVVIRAGGDRLAAAVRGKVPESASVPPYPPPLPSSDTPSSDTPS